MLFHRLQVPDPTVVIDMDERPRSFSYRELCPLCQQPASSLLDHVSHVGRHQRDLALFALPNIDGDGDSVGLDPETAGYEAVEKSADNPTGSGEGDLLGNEMKLPAGETNKTVKEGQLGSLSGRAWAALARAREAHRRHKGEREEAEAEARGDLGALQRLWARDITKPDRTDIRKVSPRYQPSLLAIS